MQCMREGRYVMVSEEKVTKVLAGKAVTSVTLVVKENSLQFADIHVGA